MSPPGGWAGASPDAEHHQQPDSTPKPTSVEHDAAQVSGGAAAANGQAPDGAQYSDYFDLISGEHAADWLGVDKWKRLSTVFGPDKAREIMTWYRTNMAYHARFLVDENGTPRGALLDELLAIPVQADQRRSAREERAADPAAGERLHRGGRLAA